MEPLLIAGLSLLMLLFFPGMETAWRYADKLRLELEGQSASLRFGMLRMVTRHQGLLTSILLTGYTLSLVAFGVSAALIARSMIPSDLLPPGVILLLLLLAVWLAVLLFGEWLPTSLFARTSPPLLALMAFPLALFAVVLMPLAGPLFLIARSVSSRQKEPPGDPLPGRLFSAGDPGHFPGEEGDEPAGSPVQVEKEVILFRNALDFSKVRLREIMVPRNEIEVLDVHSDVETLRRKFVETGFSRILFYEGNKDNIVGYVHTSAIFQKAREIKPFLKSVLIVPETMAANRLLSRFIREHRSIALVVDEFGGTAGLVTSEDILEEIFGEIEDEHDTNDFSGRKINDKSFILPGRLEIDDLNEAYHVGLPDSDQYETLAGFILFHHESIPKVHTTVTIGRWSFKILKATLTRIEMVHLTIADG